MPATNPRISVTLQPSTAALLARVCSLTGNSQSSTVGELLTQCEPVFERMALILEAADELKREADGEVQQIAGTFKRAQGRIEEQLGLCLDEWENGTGELLGAMEKIRRRTRKRTAAATGAGAGASAARPRPRTAAAEVTPPKRRRVTPACNTGVRSQDEKRGKPHPPTDSGDFSA